VPFNDDVLRWGLSVIRAVQTWEHPAFRLFFACATFLGNQTTCIVCGLCVYWALSRRKGFELCVMLWTTLAVNSALKDIFAVPRRARRPAAARRLRFARRARCALPHRRAARIGSRLPDRRRRAALLGRRGGRARCAADGAFLCLAAFLRFASGAVPAFGVPCRSGESLSPTH
jgi:hypothetical protein